MPRIAIESLDDTRLDPYRLVRFRKQTRWSQLFVAEGKRVARRLIESDFAVQSLLVTERREREFADCLDRSFPTFVLPQSMAEVLVGFNFHSGVMACGRRKPVCSAASIVASATEQCTLVACSRVQGPENMGTIIRLAAGFGISALLTGPGCADPFSRRALRVSMGTALSLPIVECPDLWKTLSDLRSARQYSLIATALDESAEPLERAHVEKRQILVFGNEADGLSETEIAACDRCITIPMHGNTDSLNVGNAAAIFLYHFTRQHALS